MAGIGEERRLSSSPQRDVHRECPKHNSHVPELPEDGTHPENQTKEWSRHGQGDGEGSLQEAAVFTANLAEPQKLLD